MRNAYALLGILFIIVFVGAYMAFERVEAPSELPLGEGSSQTNIEESAEPLPDTNVKDMSLALTSSVFEPGGSIPSKYTCDGDNTNPELRISGVPEGTESLVLVMDDPDIPESVKQSRGIEKFDHWALYNISPDTTVIPEGEGDSIGTGGLNSQGKAGYVGPCPPDKEHRYIFRLYAVSGTLNFVKAPTLDEVEAAAKGMMLEKAELIGRYERTD